MLNSVRLPGLVIILAAIYAALIVSPATAEIGMNPDPKDVCPTPLCTGGLLSNLTNAASDIASGKIDPSNFSASDFQALASKGLDKLGQEALAKISFQSLMNAMGPSVMASINISGVPNLSNLSLDNLEADTLSHMPLSTLNTSANLYNTLSSTTLDTITNDALGKLTANSFNDPAVVQNLINSMSIASLTSDALSHLTLNSFNNVAAIQSSLNSMSLSSLSQSAQAAVLSKLTLGSLNNFNPSSISLLSVNASAYGNLNVSNLKGSASAGMNVSATTPLSSLSKGQLAGLSLASLNATALANIQGLISLSSLPQQTLNSLNLTMGSLTSAAMGDVNSVISLQDLPQEELNKLNMTVGALKANAISDINSLISIQNLPQQELAKLNIGQLKQSAFSDMQSVMTLADLPQQELSKYGLNDIDPKISANLNISNIKASFLANLNLSSLLPSQLISLNFSISATATIGEDDRAKNMQLKGPMQQVTDSLSYSSSPLNKNAALDPGIQGVMTPNPMANKNTPALSLVQYFPWLYMEADQSAQSKIYRGVDANTNTRANTPVALDVQGEALSVVQSGTSGASQDLNKTKCKPITNSCGSPDTANYPVWARLQYDSCSNQYILPAGLQPNLIFSQAYRDHEYRWNESQCQPLSIMQVDCVRNANGGCYQDKGEADGQMYDYRAWGYLKLAWKNVLDSDYLPNGGYSENDAGRKPVITTGATLIGGPKITGEDQYGEIDSNEVDTSTIPGGSNYKYLVDTTSGKDFTKQDVSKDNHSYSGARTTINQLVQQPFERIWDPTHPFSPRWDWKGTDRDLSSKANLNGVPWHGYDFNTGGNCTVRCAAVPVDILSFREAEFTACMGCRIKANTDCFWVQVMALLTPVYIPNPAYEVTGIEWLYEYDALDFNYATAVEDTLKNVDPSAKILDVSTDKMWWGAPAGQWIEAVACKSYYDTQDKWPVCSTKYDVTKDNVPSKCKSCIQMAGENNQDAGIKKCCDDLAQALAPLNTLKIRNTKSNPALEPVPEGYRFSDYFTGPAQDQSLLADASSSENDYTDLTSMFKVVSNAAKTVEGKPVVHMPYMRWWDAGTAAGGSHDPKRNYNPDCDLGSYDVIMGVGIDGNRGQTGAKYCRYGGNGTANKYSCYSLPVNPNKNSATNPDGTEAIDALTSWEELKQYQLTSWRTYGLNCLPQYEKVHKPGSTEDGALRAVGGIYYTDLQDQMTDSNGNPVPVPASGQAPLKKVAQKWALGWRGYISDPDLIDQFPSTNAASGAGSGTGIKGANTLAQSAQPYSGPGTLKGLSNAQVGDIIYLTHDDVAPAVPGVNVMPFVAVVTATHPSALSSTPQCRSYNFNGQTQQLDDTFITVEDMNTGKFPDVCGNTNYEGIGQTETRTIYRQNLPGWVYENMYPAGTTVNDSCGSYTVATGVPAALTFTSNGNCKDPKLQVCTFSDPGNSGYNLWDHFRIYRPTQDVR